MKKKLNPAKIARIRERRGTGETLESLARTFKCSIGTVSNALAAPAQPSRRPKAPAKRPAEEPPGELPTADDIRRSLGDQVRDLKADVANAETPAARATANRLLVSAMQLQSRLTPPDPTVAPAGMVLVDAAEIEKLAEAGRARLHALVHDLFAEKDQ